ncbi:MAG: PEP/pyruvate-binding domain-containing protein, partial [Candidatus Zixiibacteriota bacterium]
MSCIKERLIPPNQSLEAPERLNPEGFVIDIEQYPGTNPRLLGILELKEVGALTPQPFLVLPDHAFREWCKKGMTEELQNQIKDAFDLIIQNNPERAVHLGFRVIDEEGREPQGPRSSAIWDKEKLIEKVEKAWITARQQEDDLKGAKVALCLHPFLHATDLPRPERPNLPWSGGDAIFTPDEIIEIRATPGADEAAQLFDSDLFRAFIDGRWDTGKLWVNPQIVKKTATRVPGAEDYEDIPIPKTCQEEPALDFAQVEEIARLQKRLFETFGPRRIEFIVQPEGIYFRECAPFEVKPEDLVSLTEETTQPVVIFRSEEDLEKIKPPIAFVHLPQEIFQQKRERRRDLFGLLAGSAAQENIHLVVFAWGERATLHVVRVFRDQGHDIHFVGSEKLKEKENIRVFREEGVPKWERVKEKGALIVDLKEHQDLALVGGKAANLSTLTEHGFRIPPGFCLTTKAFQDHLASLGLEEKIASLDTLKGEELSTQIGEIQQAIIDSEIPKSLKEQIQARLHQLEGTRFAVRSSADVEDGRVAFAGQFETFLNTLPEEVPEKIKMCWASTFSRRVNQYARGAGIHPSEIKMGVLIMEMIESQCGGGINTRDLFTGQPDIVITVGESADRVTAGQGTLYHITIQRHPLEIKDFPPGAENLITKEQSLSLAQKAL